MANLIAAVSGASAAAHRLVNVSTRANAETGADIVIAGFVIGGSAGTKDVLIRAVGPGLTSFGVSGVLPNPSLAIFDSSSNQIVSGAGWGNAVSPGPANDPGVSYRKATAADMSAVGAFPLTGNSADSALVMTLPPGAYTAQVQGADGTSTGVVLAEVYEMDKTSPDTLINISARCSVGVGASVAISGFVVDGNQAARLLIRGIGPGLAAFGVSGALAQPSIALFDSSNILIASNAGWGTSVVAGTSTVSANFRLATAADMASVNAFALTPGSLDSAMVVTLPPGQYTAQISGMGGNTGTCLAEVYQMSDP